MHLMTEYPPTRERKPNRSHSSGDGSIQIPPSVYAQIQALRETGLVNMHADARLVLDYVGFDEALRWVETNPEKYSEGLSHGFTPTDPEDVEEIDIDTLVDSIPMQSPPSTRSDASTHHEQRLIRELEYQRRHSDEAHTYYVDGSWRETAPLTDEELELTELFDTAGYCQQGDCYRNALLTAATFGLSHDLVYVEGYTMANSVISPIAHAWVELNGKVIELSFPDGPEASSDAAYLGIEFSLDRVRSKVFDEEVFEPLAD